MFVDSRVILLVAVGAAAALPRDATAQTEEGPPARRWSVTLASGWTDSSSHVSLERALAASGLDDTRPAGCFLFCAPAAPHPRSYPGAGALTATISYAVRPSLQLRAQWSGADLGETHGYRNDGSPFGSYMFLSQSVETLALIPALSLGGMLRLGVGPSLNFAEVADHAGLKYEESRATRLGLVADAGLSLPARSRLFLDFTAQYRYVGSPEFGPFEDPPALGGEGSRLPRTRVNFNHVALGIGFGVRF